MYTRSYLGSGDGRQSLPENYDGIAFLESNSANACADKAECIDRQEGAAPCFEGQEAVSKNPWEHQPQEAKKGATDEGVFAGFGKIPLLSGLSGIFKGRGEGGFTLSKIGTEEILIIAAALFLFLSKDGDNECAIMLLLLLLIN